MRLDVVKIPFKLNYAAPLETEKRFSILQNCIHFFLPLQLLYVSDVCSHSTAFFRFRTLIFTLYSSCETKQSDVSDAK